MAETKLKSQASNIFPQVSTDTVNISSFTSAANANEQDITGATITVTGLGSSMSVFATCKLNVSAMPAGNTNFWLYIDGVTVGNYYQGNARTGEQCIVLSGIGTVADGQNFIVKATLSNDGSNAITVYGSVGGRSNINVITFTNGQ